jgi:hypothetical protein
VNASFIGADGDGEVTVKSRTCKPTDRSNFFGALAFLTALKDTKAEYSPFRWSFPYRKRAQFFQLLR